MHTHTPRAEPLHHSRGGDDSSIAAGRYIIYTIVVTMSDQQTSYNTIDI